MSKRAEYLFQADECRKMADRANSSDVKERWLALSGKWLTLGEQVEGNGQFEAMLRDKGTGQEPSGSTN